MVARVAAGLGRQPGSVKARLGILALVVVGFNVVVWVLLALAAGRFPQLLPLALAAYTFGMRHAVDADHISAIDNTTRKLLQDGKRPVAVGFFFSLGHSTVVVALSVLLALSAAYVQQHIPALRATGQVLGTLISAAFLLLIGLINLVVLLDIYKLWRRVSRGSSYDDRSLEEYLGSRGLMARLLRPLLNVVGHSWNMYLIGLLFGLGFDTASQVALYGLSSSQFSRSLPVLYLLLLPALFTAGMALLDTLDGVLMLGAYGWAFLKPIRKLYYNMTITLMSVIVAVGVGGIEALQVLSGQFNWSGGFWSYIDDDQKGLNFETLGYYIIGTFILCWGVSTVYYRLRGYDNIPESTASGASGSGLAGASG